MLVLICKGEIYFMVSLAAGLKSRMIQTQYWFIKKKNNPPSRSVLDWSLCTEHTIQLRQLMLLRLSLKSMLDFHWTYLNCFSVRKCRECCLVLTGLNRMALKVRNTVVLLIRKNNLHFRKTQQIVILPKRKILLLLSHGAAVHCSSLLLCQPLGHSSGSKLKSQLRSSRRLWSVLGTARWVVAARWHQRGHQSKAFIVTPLFWEVQDWGAHHQIRHFSLTVFIGYVLNLFLYLWLCSDSSWQASRFTCDITNLQIFATTQSTYYSGHCHP